MLGWVDWIGDEVDYSAGACRNWACGCSASVDWLRAKPTEYGFEVGLVNGRRVSGRVVYLWDCAEGLALAKACAEAVHGVMHPTE